MYALKFENLSKFENVVHGISTREFGTMKSEDNAINRKNMNSFLAFLSLPNDCVCMEQIHGANIAIVENDKELLVKNVDGLITAKKNVPLCVVTADCLPILFYDTKNKVIGVAHGGRKGLQLGIVKNIIGKFKNDFESDPDDIVVGIGPGIEKKCYEVKGKLLDLGKIANEQLLEMGILEENIEHMDICTKCNMDKFYSYRGGDGSDRFAAVISLK